MNPLSAEKARFLLADQGKWIGPCAVSFVPLSQVPPLAIDETVVDGRTRLRAAHYLGFDLDSIPTEIVKRSDKRTIARRLLLNGHYDRAYFSLEDCWRDCARSIASHLGVPMTEALECFAARRVSKVYLQKNRKRDSYRILQQVRRYLYSVESRSVEFNEDELMRIIL